MIEILANLGMAVVVIGVAYCLIAIFLDILKVLGIFKD